MIISHKYKYLFVELPRTGSTAISEELCELYDGQSVLQKHATYFDFLKVASPEEKEYFVFSCIRNPLDDAVSHYFKYKTDHKGNFTDPKRSVKRQRGLVGRINKSIFNFLKSSDADFPTFFMKYYRLPYNNWASLSHKEFDFVIRFEHLVDDFSKVLHLIGIEPVRSLPQINQTGKREKGYLSYYTPETIDRAKRVFSPFMKQWGYEFPPEWGETSISWWNQLEFDFFNLFRNMYWRFLRFRI
jgi:hypothetical protein